jgi:hypothetical protein
LNSTYSKKIRRPKAYLSSYILNQIHVRNPWVIVWWSAAFPGAGHVLSCKFASGLMLMVWEFFVNTRAHVNTAIMYSMIGQFDKARDVLDVRWFLLYIPVYVYCMWDCYSLTVDLNKFSLIADREDSSIMPFNISTLEINYLDNRMPWNGVLWSLMTPGLGSLYVNRLPTGFFSLIAFILSVYYSHLLPAIHFTFDGMFDQATAVLNPEWLLFLPSIYGFAAYSTYVNTIESNKLFKTEQSRFLTDSYQNPRFTTLIFGAGKGANE